MAIESIDYDASGRSRHSLEGQEVMRSYYQNGAERASQVSARVILQKKKDDKAYQVEVVFKDIEGMNDHRNLQMGGDYLRLIIRSPILGATVEYGKGGGLGGFEFEGRQPVFSNGDEFDYPEPDMVDLYLIYHSVENGGDSYDVETGEHVEFRVDDDPDYIRVTSTKDDKKRIIKVPIHVDFAKIREELEEGLNLEDPYNDPPEADRWLGKDLEKVVGIVEVPMGR